MLIYVDIDKTITSGDYSTNYDQALPNYENIEKVNKLYDKGHTIIMWTARGTLSNISWFNVTMGQLNDWGVKFHELRMGKPAYDVLIDDKVYNSIHDWDNDIITNDYTNTDCEIKLTDDISIGGNNRCLIIAEVGQNHQGSFETAKKYIKACKDAGADVVKFQKTDIYAKFNNKALEREYNSVNSFGKTYGEHKKYLEFSKEEFIKLQKYAEEVGIMFSASGMDIPSFDFLEKIKCPFLKIGSGDTNNLELLKHVAKKDIPIILSTGMNNMDSVIKSVNTLLNNGVKKLCLLQCTSSYPLDDKDVNLNVIKTYKKYFKNKIVVGYSGHDKGIPITLASIALGAKVIEKHVTFDKTWKGSDHSASLNMIELKQLCEDVRRIENSMGSYEKKMVNSEIACHNKLGKSLVLTRDMKEGDIIKESDLTVKVAEPHGINPNMLFEVINRKLKYNKSFDETVKLSDIQ